MFQGERERAKYKVWLQNNKQVISIITWIQRDLGPLSEIMEVVKEANSHTDLSISFIILDSQLYRLPPRGPSLTPSPLDLSIRKRV